MQSLSKNPILFFLATRYTGYVLLFLRGLVIAKFLGTFYFGIWGFLTLVLQYLSYSSFGVNFAITVQLSTGNQSSVDKKTVQANIAINSSIILSLLLVLLGTASQWMGVELFSRFNFPQYLMLVLLIAGTTNVQQVVINILRCEKRTTVIAINEIITAVLLLTAAFYFKDGNLIESQLIVLLLADILSLVLFTFQYPYKYRLQLDWQLVKILFKLGLPLWIFNFSYYFITISIRSIISAFYPIEILGYYTLGNSIAFATLLGLQTIGWVIYPDVLSQLSKTDDKEHTRISLSRINNLYNTICFFLIFIMILFLPAIMLFLPKYQPALPVITIMVISQAVMSSSFGFNALSVSKNKQNQVALIGFAVVIFITGLGIAVSLLHYDQIWIAFILLLGAALYTVFQIKLSSELLGTGEKIKSDLLHLYPLSSIMAILLAIAGSFTLFPALFNIIACSIFFLFNRKSIIESLKTLIKEFN